MTDLRDDYTEDENQISPEESEAPLDDDEALADATPVDDGSGWYVVHSYSGMETKVKKNLEHRIESMRIANKIFQVIVPTEEQIELKDGERRVVERRVFPGYILVQMILDDESWYAVQKHARRDWLCRHRQPPYAS